MSTYITLLAIVFCLLFFPRKNYAQFHYADVAVSHTTCALPCNSGVVNASYASDGDVTTFALLNNNLGVGSYVELVTGFSTAGAPGSMVIVPIKQSAALLDANLLSLISIDILDASNTVIVSKNGVGLLDVGVLSTADSTSTITLFTPSSGASSVSKVRVRLGGALAVLTSVFVGDAFYIEPSGTNCGIKYATTYTNGGSGICVGCSVQNPDRAVDTSLTNYAQINMVIGIAASRYLQLQFPDTGRAGDFVALVLGTGSGLLDVSVLGNVTVSLYKGTTLVESSSASSLLSASLLTGGTEQTMVGFNASDDFTSIRISMTAVAGLFNSMRVYAALTYDPTPPRVSLSASPGTLICEGTSASLEATSGYASYLWSNGDSSQQIQVAAAGAYSVIGNDASGCPFFSEPIQIALKTKPVVPAVTAQALSCIGGNVRFDLDSTSTHYIYQTFRTGDEVEGDTLTGTGMTLSMFSVPVFASATYRILVTDTSNGCRALSASDMVILAPFAPTLLSSDNDKSKCWVKPGNRFVHFLQPGTSRILASINPKENDLGEVEVTAFVSDSVIHVQACNTYRPWYSTSVLNRRWLIVPETQPNSNVQVRLYFDTEEFDSLSHTANTNANPTDNLNSISELVLAKYDGANEDGDFTNNCGNGTVTNYYAGLIGVVLDSLSAFSSSGQFVQYEIPGFSEFWLHGNGGISALPITLSSFTGSCGSQGVDLEWRTESELNNAYFTLWSSKDAVEWQQIGIVDGAGNSNQTKWYSYRDMRPSLAKTTYYKLQQTDFDGQTKQFSPISISCVDTEDIQIYPNPVSDYLHVNLGNIKGENVTVTCYDIYGKVVFCQNYTSNNFDTIKTIYLGWLQNGQYSLCVKSEYTSLYKRFILVK